MRVHVLLGRTVPRVTSLWPWAWRRLEVALGTAAQTGPEQATGSRPEKRKCARILGVDGHGPGAKLGPSPRVLRPLPPLRSPAPSIHVLLTNGEDGLGWPQHRDGLEGPEDGRPARAPSRGPEGGRVRGWVELGGQRPGGQWSPLEPLHPVCAHVFPAVGQGRSESAPSRFSAVADTNTIRRRSRSLCQLSGLSTFTGRAATAPPSSELLSSSQTEPVP